MATDARPTPAANAPAWADAARTARCAAAGHTGRHYAAGDGERYCAACLGAAWYRAHGWEPLAGAAEETGK